MQLKTFEIFTKPLQEELKKRFSIIEFEIDSITLTEMPKDDIQSLQLKLYNDNFKFPKFSFLSETKDFKSQEVHNSEAQQVIGSGFHFSISKNTSIITQVDYSMKYEGGLDSVNITVSENVQRIRGNISHDTINLQLFFMGDKVETFASHAKEQKALVENTIKQNNINTLHFLESKKDDFLKDIKTLIEKRIAKNKKKQEDLDLF